MNFRRTSNARRSLWIAIVTVSSVLVACSDSEEPSSTNHGGTAGAAGIADAGGAAGSGATAGSAGGAGGAAGAAGSSGSAGFAAGGSSAAGGGAGSPSTGGAAGAPLCTGMKITNTSGNLQDGQSLQIQGCGFGSKDPAPPVLWDTVDNQPSYAGLVDGDVIPTGAPHPWLSNGGSWAEKMRYSTSRPHRGVRTAHYHGPPDQYGDAFIGWARGLSGGLQRTLYVNWWYRPAVAPDAEGGSNKFIRIWDDGNGNGTRVSWTQMHLTYSGSESAHWASWTSQGTVGEWNHHEILVDSDTKEITVWLNAAVLHHVTDFAKDPAFNNVGLNIGLIGFDHSLGDYKTQHTEVSEIYVDTTRAKVLVGDEATWQACTLREIQIPTTWSDDTIAITVNQGSFPSLSGKYLFVMNQNGQTTDGFLLP